MDKRYLIKYDENLKKYVPNTEFIQYAQYNSKGTIKESDVPDLYTSYSQNKYRANLEAKGIKLSDSAIPSWFDPAGAIDDVAQFQSYLKKKKLSAYVRDVPTYRYYYSQYEAEKNSIAEALKTKESEFEKEQRTKALKTTADLYGVSYSEGDTYLQWDPSYEKYGYTYSYTEEDRQRKAMGLPPQSFIDEYGGDKDSIKRGRVPKKIENTNELYRQYQDFTSELSRRAASGTLTEDRVVPVGKYGDSDMDNAGGTWTQAQGNQDVLQAILSKYPMLQAYLAYAAADTKKKESNKEVDAGTAAYNRLIGDEPEGAKNPFSEAFLKAYGITPDFAEKLYDEAYAAQQSGTAVAQPSGMVPQSLEDTRDVGRRAVGSSAVPGQEPTRPADRQMSFAAPVRNQQGYHSPLAMGSVSPVLRSNEKAQIEARLQREKDKLSEMTSTATQSFAAGFTGLGDSGTVSSNYVDTKNQNVQDQAAVDRQKAIVRQYEYELRNYDAKNLASVRPDAVAVSRGAQDSNNKLAKAPIQTAADLAEAERKSENTTFEKIGQALLKGTGIGYIPAYIWELKNSGIADPQEAAVALFTQEERDIVNHYYGLGQYDNAEKVFNYFAEIHAAEYSKAKAQESLERLTVRSGDNVAVRGEKKLAGIKGALEQITTAPVYWVQTGTNFALNKATGENEPTREGLVSGVLRQQTAKEQSVSEGMGTVPKFITNALLSTAKNVPTLGINLAIPGVGLAVMGASAAGQTSMQAKDSGATSGQQFALGLASGATEYLTEKLPFDNLVRGMAALKAAKSFTGAATDSAKTSVARQFLTNFLSQAGTEFGEETVSQYANTLTDIAVMGEKSDYAKYISQLTKQGISKTEAARRANVKFFVEAPLESGLMGAVSGGIFGLGGSVLSSIDNSEASDTAKLAIAKVMAGEDLTQVEIDSFLPMKSKNRKSFQDELGTVLPNTVKGTRQAVQDTIISRRTTQAADVQESARDINVPPTAQAAQEPVQATGESTTETVAGPVQSAEADTTQAVSSSVKTAPNTGATLEGNISTPAASSPVYGGVSGTTQANANKETSTDTQQNVPGSTGVEAAVVTPITNHVNRVGVASRAQSIEAIKTVARNGLGIIGGQYNFKRPYNAVLNSKMQGWYQPLTNVVGTKNASDLEVLFHEIGHKLDNQYGLRNNLNAVQELQKNYLTPRITQNYKKAQYPAEMIADFMRDFIMAPDTAKANAPTFFATVTDALKADKGRVQTIDTLRQMIADFAAQSNREKTKGHIVSYGTKRIVPKALTRGEAARNAFSYGKNAVVKAIDLAVENFMDTRYALDDFEILANQLGATIRGKEVTQRAGMTDLVGNIASQLITNKLSKPMTEDGSLGAVIGDSYASLFKWVQSPEQFNDFVAYLVLKHAADRKSVGKEALPASFGDPAAEVQKYDRDFPEFSQRADAIYDWWNKFIKAWYVDTKIVDQAAYDKMRQMYPHYVPFYRYFGDMVTDGLYKYNGVGKGFSAQTSHIKRAKQSDRPIMNPIQSMMADIVKVVNVNTKVETMRAIQETYDKSPADFDDFLYAVDAEKVVESMSLEGTKAQAVEKLIKRGMADADAADLIDDLLPNDRLFAVYDKSIKQDRTPNVLSVIDRNGNPRFFMTENPAFLTAVKQLGPPQGVSKWLQTFSKASKAFKTVTTGYNPMFSVRNIFRDTQDAFVFGSQTGPIDFAKSLGSAFVDLFGAAMYDTFNGKVGKKQHQAIQDFLRSGMGSDLGYYSDNLDSAQNATVKNFQSLTKAERVKRLAKRYTVDLATTIFGISESANRLAEYNRSKARGETDLAALNNSLNVTLNFYRKGNATRTIGAVIPFFNAQMQDVYRIVRMLKRGDTAAGRAVIGRAMTRMAISQVMLTVLEAALHQMWDDDDYESLDGSLKDRYWILWKTEDGKFIRLPKPNSIASVFLSSMSRRVTETIMGDKGAWEDFGESMKSQILPSFLWGALVDVGANRTWYGGQIENYADKQVASEARYDGDTSWVAYALGQITKHGSGDTPWTDGLSPKEWQYLIDQYTGFVGDFILPLTAMDKSGMESLINTASSLFTSDPVMSNKYMSQYYDKSDKLESIINTIEREGKYSGVDMPADRFVKLVDKELGKVLDDADGALKEYKNEVKRIKANPYSAQKRTELNRRAREKVNRELEKAVKSINEFYKKYNVK